MVTLFIGTLILGVAVSGLILVPYYYFADHDFYESCKKGQLGFICFVVFWLGIVSWLVVAAGIGWAIGTYLINPFIYGG